MKFLAGCATAISWMNDRIGRWLICYLPMVMFLLLVIEVVARYVFAAPTIWASELAQMVFALYVILSGGYLLFHDSHVRVDVIYSRFSAKGKAIADIATSLLFFAFVLVLLKEGWNVAEGAVSRWESSHSAWDPPIWPLKVAIPVGAGLLLLQGVAKLIRDIEILVCSSPAPARSDERSAP
ncbi:TRAP transporter small permease subunit [Salinisphaera sp. C84B14]|uniref:TRAP transporter small permease subunit n=1 Tax=Salinisphaera sp. C84B14 TaxID=1304155 RepID=UPI003341145C